jgi:hypothetical protein
VGCATRDGAPWDSSLGPTYALDRGGLTVLTLNLHCQQEAEPEAERARGALVGSAPA